MGDFFRSGTELLTSASLRYAPARDHELSLTHSSSYTRPSYRDLLGYTSIASAAFRREGNSGLRTAYRRGLSLNYTYMRAAQLELSYSDTEVPS